MPSKIEDYALIGDCETAALVNREGSIDWLCWPDFSSGACFAALLGTEKHGYWKICPTGEGWKSSRKYRDHTLILETIFENEDGAIRLIDFMPIRERNSDVIRIVEGIRGSMNMTMLLSLRFDYGRTIPWVTALDAASGNGIRAIAGPGIAVLHASVPVHGENLHTAAEFTVNKGDRVWFTLTYGESFRTDPRPINAERAFKDTEHFWRHWTSQLKYDGEYADAVERSLITLKAMTFRPTGGLVASVTTSLPEFIGGPRNWDYRYCWLRDTTLTLLVMTTAGWTGSCARSAAALTRCRSCTDSRASANSSSGKSAGSPATKARAPSASATPPPGRFSSISTANFSVPSCTRSTAWVSTPPTISASLCSSSTTSKPSGSAPTKASGKLAAAASNSPTPK
jgi:GH15 family glucan-1,4-alpha-glucosidase